MYCKGGKLHSYELKIYDDPETLGLIIWSKNNIISAMFSPNSINCLIETQDNKGVNYWNNTSEFLNYVCK